MESNFPGIPSTGPTWKILLIEDDEEDFFLVREMLRAAKGRKVELVWVSTYEAGQQALAASCYDAVLVDYDIGARTGIQLIRETTEMGYAAPLILFTGRGNYEVDLEAMQAGATLYLTKSEANPLLLERAIRYAIEIKQKEHELRLSSERLEQELAERKKAEEALQVSEARWREFLESTHDNFIALDRQWRFTYANRHYGEVMGIDPQELVGKNYWELFPHYLGTDLEANYRKVMAEGLPLHYRQGGIYTDSLYDVSVYPTQEGLAIFSIDRSEEHRNQLRMENERARLEAVLQALPVAVWIADRDGRLIFKNRQVDQIWGGDAPLSNSVDQYRDYVAWFLDSGEPVGADQFPVAQALRTGQPRQPVELRIQRFDGTQGTVLAIGAPIHDREGRLSGAVAVNMDITERKWVEDALSRSEEKFAKSFRASPIALAISTVEDGRFIEVNDSYTALFGFSREELIGHTSIELGMFPDPVEREEIKRQFRSGNGFRNYEIRLLTRSGEPRDVLFSTEPIEVEGQECMLSLVIDVSERKKSELEIRENEARFRYLADAMPQLVWTAKQDGTVDYYNNRYHEFDGIALAENGVWEWGPVVHPDELEQTIAAWNLAVRTGEMYQIEHRIRMADGTFRWHLSRGIPIKDRDGRVVRWYGTATDIADQKEIEERLRRSNQELEQFALIASHDLQEPLRKIIMFGRSLRNVSGQALPLEAVDHLSRMENAAERMQAMIHGLLELSRAGARGGDFKPVNLTRLVAGVVSDLEPRIRAVKGQVVVNSLPTVQGDEVQLRQLFQNLVSNALKFHKDDIPPVVHLSGTISHKLESLVAEIQIQDNGIGFEQQYADLIFQPFQRLHGRHVYEGTGLGLSICQRIAERHFGTIEVQSTPGEGSTFTIRLPLR